MVDRGVYTLRGWLAFVAFLDFAQAVRSWLDKDIFLGSYHFNNLNSTNMWTDNEKATVPPSTARILIAYSVLNGNILVMCAFCIHHWPMIVMAAISLITKMAYLTLEALRFKSTPFSFHLVFPIVVDGITLVALFFSPKLLQKEVLGDHENEEILKSCNGKPIYFPPNKKKKTL